MRKPWVRPRLKGEGFLIRYADDFVIGVAREDDARRIMEVLPKRMSKYGLTVHPGKTRVVRFHPADVADSEPADQNSTGPRTFDFLGFTHYWGRSRRGGWVVNARRRRADSSECWTRRRRGAGRTCTCRLEINTRGSRRSWKAITVTMGSSVTMPASRSFCGPPAGSGNDGCRGVAGTNRCCGRGSCGWSSITVFPRPVRSTAC